MKCSIKYQYKISYMGLKIFYLIIKDKQDNAKYFKVHFLNQL